MADSFRIFNMIDNYIYLYHTDTLIAIPTYADSISDSMGVSFQTSYPLARSAPIYSYANSGPRILTVKLDLHRDLMQLINYGVSNLQVTMDDDYVDLLIRGLQSCVVPEYNTSDKMVNPPILALRMGKDIFIKGVIQGSVGVTYLLPILRNDKYASVTLQFSILEIDPYGASDIMQQGSFRGLSKTLERRVYKASI